MGFRRLPIANLCPGLTPRSANCFFHRAPREDRTSCRVSTRSLRSSEVDRSAFRDWLVIGRSIRRVKTIWPDNLHVAFRDERMRSLRGTYTPGIPVSVRAREWSPIEDVAHDSRGRRVLETRVFLSRCH